MEAVNDRDRPTMAPSIRAGLIAVRGSLPTEMREISNRRGSRKKMKTLFLDTL